MQNKILRLVVCGFMTLSLLIAACAPAATPTTPAIPNTTTTPITRTNPTTTPAQAVELPQKEAVQPATSLPKYGGTLTYTIASDPVNFDSGINRRGGALINTVYQQFISQDWSKGPAGSKQNPYVWIVGNLDDYGPQIAASWKMPELGTWKLQIRQGMHWQPVDSPAGRLMAGREITTEDIIAGFNRLLNKDGSAPDSWIVTGTAAIVAKTATIEKTGTWEVTIKTPQEYMTAFSYLITGLGFYRIYPPDVIKKYGNIGDWRNTVGTGPFMLVDYVPGSQMLYKKNPLYWEKDPVGPGKGNQLPYVDDLRELIIPDASTVSAAFRTGKLDLYSGVSLVDAQGLWKTTPKAEYFRYLDSTWVLAMRTDKKDKPFNDIRVRQALMLATDFQAIKTQYYSGEAELDVWPVNNTLSALYVPLKDMPKTVQDLYVYNPDKAKQLLKEAGYPNGFKTSIIVQSTAARIDELSLFKDMWSKVGVDLTLEPKESGTYASYTIAGTPFNEMLLVTVGPGFPQCLYMGNTRGPGIWNPSHINDPPGADPYMEDLFNKFNANLFVNMPKLYDLVKEQHRYLMEGAFAIPRPSPYNYNFWWPWIKNYYGQGTTLVRYAWVDQDLKKAMGH